MQIEEKQITIHALQKIINNKIHVHLSILNTRYIKTAVELRSTSPLSD